MSTDPTQSKSPTIFKINLNLEYFTLDNLYFSIISVGTQNRYTKLPTAKPFDLHTAKRDIVILL